MCVCGGGVFKSELIVYDPANYEIVEFIAIKIQITESLIKGTG